MILDALLTFSNAQSLTALTAGTATASTNSLDFSTARDLGPSDALKLFAMCPVPPASATAGTTITVALQGSVDNVNWITIEQSGAVPIANITGYAPFIWRTQLPFFGALYRYLQLSITASAALTAGALTAGLALDLPRDISYPRNFAA